MSDIDTVKKLTNLVPQAIFEFDQEKCVKVSLSDKNCIWHGFARHSKDKATILRLISQLENLVYLDLRKNRFGEIPNLALQKLEHVDLASNYMGIIPEWLKGLNLKYLNLGVNELSVVPDWFSDFSNLNTLKLHKNKIRHVPPICNSILFLNLYFNQMKDIPKFVWGLYQLEFFSWGVSAVERLPNEIGNLKQLQWLSMVGNKLAELPQEFCQLVNLKGIRLHKNRLTQLPERIGDLIKLEQLTLYCNELKCLPESFHRLNLKKLNLAHNNFDAPPQVNADWICYEASDCLWYE